MTNLENEDLYRPPLPTVAGLMFLARSKLTVRGFTLAMTPAEQRWRQIISASQGERETCLLSLAMPDLWNLIDQPKPVSFVDVDGRQRTHRFDYLAEFKNGRRVAIAVKPAERVERLNFKATLQAIKRDLPLKSLQALGAIDMIKITSSLRYLLRSQVTELLEKLDALPPSLPDRSVVPLREFCHLKQVSIVQIIDLWVRGKLEGRLCRGEGIGLQSLEVDWGFLSHKALVELIGDLTAEEAARYLKVNVAGIRRLRDAGYLEEISRRNPDTNHCKRYITKQSISAFEQQYVTLGQLANNQDIRPIHLAQKLDRDGVAPITCNAGPVRAYAIDVLNEGGNYG